MERSQLMTIKRLALILLGSFISAIAVNMFFIPFKLLSGGIGGISLIIQYLSGIPAGYFIILLNIPLFILSIKEVDKQFTVLTIFGTVAQSIFLIITKNVSYYFHLKDILLSGIYGGVLQGAAMGIIFSNHGSLAGSDIISVIMRKKYDYDVGKINFIINLIIIAIGSAFFGLEKGLYTLMSMYIVSYTVDKFIKGFNRKKLLFIITEKEEEINERIKVDLNRSSTLFYAEGYYTKHKIKVIYCVVSLTQVPKLKHIVNKIDPRAFISILDASEVQGKGFKNIF